MNAKYARSQIWLHWITVLLFLGAFFTHEAMEKLFDQRMDGELSPFPTPHSIMGILVLVLAITRIVLKFRHPAPALPSEMPNWMVFASKATHVGLYFVMIFIPVSGMAAWFGGVSPAAEGHEVLFKIFMALLLLHIGATLYHQFIVKDGLFSRMWF